MQRSYRVVSLIVILAIIVAGFIFWYVEVDKQMKNSYEQLSSLRRELDVLNGEKTNMNTILEQADTDSFIVQQARIKYDYISENDVLFVIDNPEKLYE